MHKLKVVSKVFLLLFFLMCTTGSATLPTKSPVSKRVAVVFLKHSPPFCPNEAACMPTFKPALRDAIHAPRHTAAQYEAMLKFTMTPYISEATYNLSNLTFEAILNPDSADGWFDAPHQLHEYNTPHHVVPGPGKASVYLDALALTYPLVGSAISDYDILLVVENIQFLFGYTSGCGYFAPGDYVTCGISAGPHNLEMSLLRVGENPDDDGFLEAAAHELGHVHNLYHVDMHSYDIVGRSDVLTHYGGWSKTFAGWLTGITDMPCIQGECEITTDLTPLKRPGNNVLRIPFIAGPDLEFLGYFVECRAKIGFDAKIPEAGVIITSVDALSSPDLAASLVFPTGGNNYFDAALAPGESFTDEDRKITITYLSKDGVNNCKVKAERGAVYAPDPSIRQDSKEATSVGYFKYGARPIWMDSQQNGWDVYPFDTVYSMEGEHVVPSGSGDPFWVGHENRIHFIIQNKGYGPAENVEVGVYVAQPIIIDIPGITCGPKEKASELIGTLVIDHLEKDAFFDGYVTWTPEYNRAAQVEVVISDYTGEITHSNNKAYETYMPQLNISDLIAGGVSSELIETVASNAGIPRTETIAIDAVETCLTDIPFFLQPIEVKAIARRDWVMEVTPAQGLAQPGEASEVQLMSVPPVDAQPGDCQDVGFMVIAPIDDFFTPVDAFIYRHCVVEVAKLTCNTPQEALAPDSMVKVSGTLTPAAEDSNIALEFTSPGGTSFIENAKIEKGGGFGLDYLPEEAGKWKVQAFWQGDDKTSAAESEMCYFTIESGKPEFTLNHNINCRLGPGTEYPVTTSGRIGDVIEIEARSPDALWLYGKMKNSKCWMSLELGKLNVNPWALSARQPPPKPVEPQPDGTCSGYTTEAVCLRHKNDCKWVVEATGAGACKPK